MVVELDASVGVPPAEALADASNSIELDLPVVLVWENAWSIDISIIAPLVSINLVHYNISFEKENEKDRITAPISSIQDLCYGALALKLMISRSPSD